PAQLLTLSGDSGGSFKLSYNGKAASAPLTRTDEVQVLTVSGSDGDKVQLSLDGVSGSVDTELKIQSGVSPTAAEVQAHLSSIPALNSTGNAVVTGPVGGPFTITFSGALSGVNVSQLQSSLASTTVTTTVQGAAPTAAEVATNLTTIAALNGHV